MENLNKENFFNDLMKKCPKTVDSFCKWIDEYKKNVNWNKLFNSDSNWQDADGKNALAPKFHEIPIEMQVGILSRFFIEKYDGALITVVWEFDLIKHEVESEFLNLEKQLK